VIAYVNGSSGGNASGTDVTVTKPSGVADGDILVAVLYREGGAWTLPSGWAWVDTGTPETKCNISAAWVGLAWKRASSEGASYVFQLSASAWRVVTMGAWSGCATSGNPFDVFNSTTTAATTVTAASITTTVANTMLVVGAACFSGADLGVASSGMTQRAELGGCELFEEAQASADAAGTAAHFRLYASDGTTCHLQGTVTATGGGGDLTLDNTSIASAQVVTITSFGWTEPNS